MKVDRRGVSLVLAIVAAIALVALAARGDHADPGASGGSLPSTLTGTAQAMALIVLGLVSVAMVALMLWTLVPSPAQMTLERPKRSIWQRAAGIATVLVLALLLSRARPAQHTTTKLGDTGSTGVAGDPSSVNDGAAHGGPAWGLGFGGVALLLVAGGAVAMRGRRTAPVLAAAGAPVVATPEERSSAVEDAEQCTDPRQSVLLAFAAAEAVLSADPATRRPPSTSAREWDHTIGDPALRTIVARYEVARFSQHAVSNDDRTAALAALRALVERTLVRK